MLSVETCAEMFPKHNGITTTSESFALNLTISVPLKSK